MHHTEICLSFPDETAAERGLALFRDMIRTAYANRKKMFPAETGPNTLVLCQKFFLYRGLVRDYDPGNDFPFCRISCLKREACDVILDKAADLQQMIGSLKPREDEFFIQLCEASALAEPDTPFTASCVFEETVSGTQQIAGLNTGTGRCGCACPGSWTTNRKKRKSKAPRGRFSKDNFPLRNFPALCSAPLCRRFFIFPRPARPGCGKKAASSE